MLEKKTDKYILRPKQCHFIKSNCGTGKGAIIQSIYNQLDNGSISTHGLNLAMFQPKEKKQ
jgi:hypothetical protein